MSSVIHTLPKVDLCCSLLGALDAETLATVSGDTADGVAAEIAAVHAKMGRNAEGGGDVGSWLAGLDALASRFTRAAQLEAVAYVLGQRLIRDSVVHVELGIDPLRPAIDAGEVAAALERGFERACEDSDDALLSWRLSAEARRGDDAEAWGAAFASMREAVGERICSVAIVGDERVPADALIAAVQRVRGELPLLVTAGFGGAKRELQAALALQPKRVLYGVSLLRDEAACADLRARRVPVVALPSVELRCVLGRPGAPPVLGKLVDAGLFAMLASGAPGVFGSNLSGEFERTSNALTWRLDQLRTLTARAVEVAFIDPRLRFVVARAVENWRHRPRLTAGPTDDGYGM